jgi:hypothetical protein
MINTKIIETMKTKLFVLSFFLIWCIPSLSQTSENIKGFSDLRLFYNVSFISEDPFTIPYGAGLSTSFTLNKRLSLDFGLTIKPTEKKIDDRTYPGDWSFPSSHSHSELSSFFMDIPIHVNYQLIKLKSFRILGSSGPRIFYIKNTRDLTMTTDNRDPFYATIKHNNLNLGLDLGFIESINLTKKIGVFASQHYGKALIGYSLGFESTDLKFGLTYRFK